MAGEGHVRVRRRLRKRRLAVDKSVAAKEVEVAPMRNEVEQLIRHPFADGEAECVDVHDEVEDVGWIVLVDPLLTSPPSVDASIEHDGTSISTWADVQQDVAVCAARPRPRVGAAPVERERCDGVPWGKESARVKQLLWRR